MESSRLVVACARTRVAAENTKPGGLGLASGGCRHVLMTHRLPSKAAANTETTETTEMTSREAHMGGQLWIDLGETCRQSVPG